MDIDEKHFEKLFLQVNTAWQESESMWIKLASVLALTYELSSYKDMVNKVEQLVKINLDLQRQLDLMSDDLRDCEESK